MAYRLDLDTDDLIRRYKAGSGEPQLARELGVSRGVITRRLNEAGVVRRSHSAAAVLRYQTMPLEERRKIVRAANEASRGRRHTFEERCLMARTHEARQTGISERERVLQRLLAACGVEARLQTAIGPYNADLTTGAVAVEVFGGHWHGSGRHAQRARKRTRYILDQGWVLVVVWDTKRHPLGVRAAQNIVALAKAASLDETLRRQHWVIWGCGEPPPGGGRDMDDIAGVPPHHRGDCPRP